jgi:hypothetical protein
MMLLVIRANEAAERCRQSFASRKSDLQELTRLQTRTRMGLRTLGTKTRRRLRHRRTHTIHAMDHSNNGTPKIQHTDVRIHAPTRGVHPRRPRRLLHPTVRRREGTQLCHVQVCRRVDRASTKEQNPYVSTTVLPDQSAGAVPAQTGEGAIES